MVWCRLVRHGLPNSTSGIAAFGGKTRDKPSWFSSLFNREPTLYFDKDLMPVDVDETSYRYFYG